MKLLFSSNDFSGCKQLRTIGHLCTRSLAVLACCLGVALSEGQVANGLATGPFNIVPVGQAAGSKVPSDDFAAINPSVTYNSNNVDSYSGQFTAPDRADGQIAQSRRGHGPSLSGLSCSSASVTGAGSDTCTVTLSSAAGSSGLSVSLASNSGAATVPAVAQIRPFAISAGFTVSVLAVTIAQKVTLTASAGGVSKSFALQLNPVATTVPTLSINPTNLVFGNVTINTATAQPVTLTSTGTGPVTISSATLSGAGFTVSGVTFPVTLNPNLALTLEVQFDPSTAGASTGQLTITSNSSTNGTAAISLSGIGEVAQHQANVSWNAPAGSADPITGYHIYRSAGGSNTYQLLNSSVDTQTTYVDSTVQSGSTYNYIVKSVDSAGIESVPSSQVSAAVP